MATTEKNVRAQQGEAPVPPHVDQQIQAIASLFADVERRAGRHQRAIERVTSAIGQPAVLYSFALASLAWIAFNAFGNRFGWTRIDPPPFLLLDSVACVAALLFTLMILTTQNRLAKLGQQRAALDLQVTLIAEEKVAKLIALVEELRRDLPTVKNRHDPLADEMTEAVDVKAVAEELEAIDEGRKS